MASSNDVFSSSDLGASPLQQLTTIYRRNDAERRAQQPAPAQPEASDVLDEMRDQAEAQVERHTILYPQLGNPALWSHGPKPAK